MKLMTKELAQKLPKIKSTDGQGGNAMVVLKIFDPCGSGTWYITEYDGKDELFGLVTGLGEDELGYISLEELSCVRNRIGLPLERDLYWTPKPLKEVPGCPDWLKT